MDASRIRSSWGRRAGAGLLWVALAASLPVACRWDGGDRGDAAPPARPRTLLLVGMDALEWSVALPMARRGDLPVLRGLMERGVFGRLATTRPTLSPIIWTTIATGKAPREHGILGFSTGNRVDGRLYNNLDRRTKAVWNILSDHDRRVGVVGWYMTFPVEAVNGVMVAQTQTAEQLDRRQGRAIMQGRLVGGLGAQVHPPGREAEMMALREEVAGSLPERMRAIFGGFRHPLGPVLARHWENSKWSVEADATFLEIARRLAAERPAYDFLAVYAAGADVLGHRFWRHHEPGAFTPPPDARELEDFQDVLEDYYRFLDARLGALLAAAPPDTTVLVVSDHGMHAVNRKADFERDHADALPDDPNRLHSGHHRDAPDGVLVAAGPGIRRLAYEAPLDALEKDDLVVVGSIFDVTPTVLALLGVPVGEDMAGRVIEPLLDGGFRGERVASHDDPEWLARRARRSPEQVSHAADAERTRQLEALGYLR